MVRFRFIKVAALLFVCFSLLGFVLLGITQRIESDELWNIIHRTCVPSLDSGEVPAPCITVDLTHGEANGFAVVKDKEGPTQFLLIPTAKISGIESSTILKPGATNYFANAWEATALVAREIGHPLPHTAFALAINSMSGRSQNQLHIHIDCIQQNIRSILLGLAPHIHTQWSYLPVKLAGHDYRAMWIPGTNLGERNPFLLLRDSLPNPSEEMGSHTLVLVGAKRDNVSGFILLDSKAARWASLLSPWVKLGSGSGEELEDHSCKIADRL
jgi:CDP-diacylglycerol pyrophosphatase